MTELEKLRQELEEAKECEFEQRKAVNIYHKVTLKCKQERDGLAAWAKVLHDARMKWSGLAVNDAQFIIDIIESLEESPSASLKQHDNEVIDKVLNILTGIDSTETQDINGWWETSAGARFGAEILEAISHLKGER